MPRIILCDSGLGGLDIAALTGLYLGGAAEGLPVVADGFISASAALLAVRMAPVCREDILPSHISEEPAVQYVLPSGYFCVVVPSPLFFGRSYSGFRRIR